MESSEKESAQKDSGNSMIQQVKYVGNKESDESSAQAKNREPAKDNSQVEISKEGSNIKKKEIPKMLMKKELVLKI